MKTSALIVALAVTVFSLPAIAAPKTYQVTGPILEMSADKIVVQKGSEKWEIATGSAAVPADAKVGSKVTIMYSMTADSVAVKDAPKAKPTATHPTKTK